MCGWKPFKCQCLAKLSSLRQSYRITPEFSSLAAPYRLTPGLPLPHHSTPYNNYLSGDGKSYIWAGPGYYVPSERTWIRYPDYRHLPRETRRDAIDFQSEDAWVDFMRNRDQPSGESLAVNDVAYFVFLHVVVQNVRPPGS